MPVPLLDLRAQHAAIRDTVVEKMMKVVDSQLFILGAAVEELEQQVAELSHTKYAIGCASGTDAILLAMRALDIGRGDEVITTPFTFFATAGTIHNVGATPVFVDIDPKTFNISPKAVAAAITPKTKAIIPVDLFGQMAAMEEVSRVAKGIPVIEDAAQSIGARRSAAGDRRPTERRRGNADGRRAGDDRHLQLLSVEESRRLRRRRDDRHAGRK